MSQEKIPEKIPTGQLDAQEALIGTWEVVESDVPRISKLKIAVNEKQDKQLEIKLLGERAKEDKDDGQAVRLFSLSRYKDSTDSKKDSVIAFATRKGSGAAMEYYTLKLQDDVLELEGVKIDEKNGSRLISASFEKSGNSAAAKNDKKSDAAEKSPAKPDAKSKLGKLAGRIESGSTLRGKLTLTPLAEKVSPADGIEVGSASPQFSFTNVPEGEYTLTFLGTVNGVTKRLSWQGLKANLDGKGEPLSLSLKLAVAGP